MASSYTDILASLQNAVIAINNLNSTVSGVLAPPSGGGGGGSGVVNYTAPYPAAVTRPIATGPVPKLGDLVSVLDFGVSNTGTDTTTNFQNAISQATAIVVPPGTYTLSSSILFPSNRYVWIQKGANITMTGGRFTGYVPGGGNITLQIDGVCAFLNTADRADIPAWDTGPGGLPFLGGIIEMGGSQAQPANGLHVFGTGEVYSDYVWPGSPPTGYFNMNYQLFRKGIAFFWANQTSIIGINIHNIYGECLYLQGSANQYDCIMKNNYVHEVAFNGLNFNTFSGLGFVMEGNYVVNAWQGIEASGGSVTDNYIITATNGIITGAGGGYQTLKIDRNRLQNVTNGIQISFSPTTIETVSINGNQIHNPFGIGITLANIDAFTCNDNIVLGWASTQAAAALQIFSTASNGIANNNMFRAPGALSTGYLLNGGINVTTANNLFA